MEMGMKHQEDIEVTITNTGNHDLLLGTNWLKAHNPSID
jgi:excinuclease UvrABC nuclease subunit